MSRRLLLVCFVIGAIHCVLSCPSAKKAAKEESKDAPQPTIPEAVNNDRRPQSGGTDSPAKEESKDAPQPTFPEAAENDRQPQSGGTDSRMPGAQSPSQSSSGSRSAAANSPASARIPDRRPAPSELTSVTTNVSSIYRNSTGCYGLNIAEEEALVRVLTDDKSMTHEKCAAGCLKVSRKATFNHCPLRCTGDGTQPCGGRGLYLFYKLQPMASNLKPEDLNRPVVRVVPDLPQPMEICSNINNFFMDYYRRFVLANTSHEKCAQSCMHQISPVYTHFGLSGLTCYCFDFSFRPSYSSFTANKADSIYCQVRCTGSPTQVCAGDPFLAIFPLVSKPTTSESTDVARPVVRVVPLLPWKPVGCFEHAAEITLKPDNMLVGPYLQWYHQSCATECIRIRAYPAFKYFALSDGGKCLCASKLPQKNLNTSEINCQQRCEYNQTQTCGGIGHWSFFLLRTKQTTSEPVYLKVPLYRVGYDNLNRSSPVGCFRMSQLRFKMVTRDHEAMDHDMCMLNCIRTKVVPMYQYYGISRGTTCFCGYDEDIIDRYNAKEMTPLCISSCSGNPGEYYCGNKYEAIYIVVHKYHSELVIYDWIQVEELAHE